MQIIVILFQSLKKWLRFFSLNFSKFFIFTLVSSASFANTVEITPFIWDITMNGRVQVSYKKAHVDQKKPGGILAMEISKNKFKLFANVVYSRVSANYSRGFYSADITNKFGIFTGALGYEVYKWQFSNSSDINLIRFEPYAGLRYTLKDTDVNIKVFGMQTNMSHHQQWTDPILGMNVSYPFVKNWSLWLSGDIGGTNAASDYSYQTSAFIKYHSETVLRHFSVYAGYKILDQHYIHGHGLDHFDWNIKLFGPLVGVSLSF